MRCLTILLDFEVDGLGFQENFEERGRRREYLSTVQLFSQSREEYHLDRITSGVNENVFPNHSGEKEELYYT